MAATVFVYEGISKLGDVVSGKISADKQEEAIESLKKQGLTVINISEVKNVGGFSFGKKKVATADLSIFSRQLASMIGAGIPLTRSLTTIKAQVANPTLAEALNDVTKKVESGMTFTDALSEYPTIFPRLFIGLVFAGELGGKLDMTLNSLAVQLQNQKKLADNVKSATMYPKMMLGFACVVLLVMLVFLVPIFAGMFPDPEKIPGLTKIIIAASVFVRTRWYVLIIVIVGLVIGFKTFLGSESGKVIWDKFSFKVPLFGKLIKLVTITRFVRTLAILLESGVPITQSLTTAGSSSGSLVLANAIVEVADHVEQGNELAAEFDRVGMFPPMVIHMTAVGEEAGTLPVMLDKIAEFYEEEVAVMTKGLSSIIEPVMLVLVGLIIGGVMISLYLPIFTSVTSIGG